MTKNDIIEELFLSKRFNEFIGKLNPEDLRDDLKAEVILIMLEKPDELIQELHEGKKVLFYAINITMKQIMSNTSPFYKKFRLNYIPIGPTNNNWAELYDKEVGGWEKEINSLIQNINKYAANNDDIEARQLKELREDKAMAYIESMPEGDYDKEIVKLYLKLGNYRAIEQETSVNGHPGIPWESCYSTVRKVIKQIREHVNS